MPHQSILSSAIVIALETANRMNGPATRDIVAAWRADQFTELATPRYQIDRRGMPNQRSYCPAAYHAAALPLAVLDASRFFMPLPI